MADLSRFESVFRSAESPRDKFLSRLFGIFSEDIIRFWCADPHSPYEDLGRPTVRRLDGAPGRGHTLDFTFRPRGDGRVYVGEMKCELEYQGYKYLTLTSTEQLRHHSKDSFQVFLDLAKRPGDYAVTSAGRGYAPSGAILVWGRATEEGRERVIRECGLKEVLTVEEIINDLISWGNEEYSAFLNKREAWCRELFKGLRESATG